MPVHIGQMTTDVMVQPADVSAPTVNEAPPVWSELERFRKALEHERAVRLRTHAGPYDD